jgi:hypothetical protein
MLRKSKLITGFLSACLLLPQLAQAAEYVVGISPYLPPAQAKTQAAQVNKFLLTTLQPGDTGSVFDAYRLKTVAKYSVPSNPLYKNLKVKFKFNETAIRSLAQFAAASHAPNGVNEPKKPGAIQAPQFLRFLGNNYPGQSMDILVMGSPLYGSSQTPAYSMESGLVPGLGQLQFSVGTTPFGIDNPKILTGKRIHWYTGGTNWSLHERHRWFVERFLTLFISRQGGVLASFQDDLQTVVNHVQAHRATPQSRYPTVPQAKKLQMLQVVVPRLKSDASIFNRPITQNKPSAALVANAQNVEFAIRWDCSQCDLDLYVQPMPATKTLYYGNVDDPWGHYVKDFRSSPVKNFYETVQLTKKAVDLKQTLVAIDFYDGHASRPVTGELRLSWQGRTYRKAFTIAALQGNGGRQAQEMLRLRRAPSPHWVVFNLPEVLGL